MLYFAYGSNLDPDQMKSRCPGHQVVGMAVMHDHQMVFPLTSHDWGGGVAGVQMHHGAELWGMVFELTDDDLAALDRYEGYRGPGDQHNLYDRETVFARQFHDRIHINGLSEDVDDDDRSCAWREAFANRLRG